MMMIAALRYSVLLVLLLPFCKGFVVVPHGAKRTTPLRLSQVAAADEEDGALAASTSTTVSRRVAFVTAAALAAGASPVQAASLEKQVLALEKANLATVNTVCAPEKHLPQVSVMDDGTTVQVVVPHVMDPAKPHFIQYIWLQNVKNKKVVAVQSFVATDTAPPTLTATNLAAGCTLQAYLWCNLHGLWQGEPFSV